MTVPSTIRAARGSYDSGRSSLSGWTKLDHALDTTKQPVRHLRMLLKPLKKSYDHLFLDCPTSLATLSESVFFAADLLLIPVIPTTLSLRTLDQIQRHLKKKAARPPRVLPFFCMVDRVQVAMKITDAILTQINIT